MKLKKIEASYVIVPLTIVAVMFVIAAFTGMWPWKDNGYNSYTLQACAWLKGRLDLGMNYEWLELAVYNGNYYVSFPPFPSFVMLPFAAIFGTDTPDHWIALAVTLMGAVYAVKLTRTVTREQRDATFFVYFLYLASGLMYVGINGYVWFIAQNMCFTLSLMALYYAVQKKGGIALACWACAVGCRPMVAFFLPVLLVILWRAVKKTETNVTFAKVLKTQWKWAIAPALIAAVYMVLNYMRFGSPLEFGHNYLPEFTRTKTGQFNLAYLWGNLKNLFRLPQATDGSGPLRFFVYDGMAFWLLTPLFITVFAALVYHLVRAGKKDIVLSILIPVLFVVHVLFVCCHRTMGGFHFGNRYLLDALPYLFYGLLVWKPQGHWFAKWNQPLFYLGLTINVVGTVANYNAWIG